MMKSLLPVLAIVLSTACTITPQDPHVKSDLLWPFNPEQGWTVSKVKAHKDMHMCVISAGRNAIDIITWKEKEHAHFAIKSTKEISPGVMWQIRVGTEVFRAYNGWFQGEEAAAIMRAFLLTDKAYLEWNEPSGYKYRRDTTSNMLYLKPLAGKLASCSTLK